MMFTHVVNADKRTWIDRELFTFTMCGEMKSQGEIFTQHMVILPDTANISDYTNCEGCRGQG